jgi:hypothetical protein
MDSPYFSLEASLVSGSDFQPSVSSENAALFSLVQQAKFQEFFDLRSIRSLLDVTEITTVEDVFRALKVKVLEYIADAEGPTVEREFVVLMAGIACLNLFVQANWTGPPVQGLVSPCVALSAVMESQPEVRCFLFPSSICLFPHVQRLGVAGILCSISVSRR